MTATSHERLERLCRPEALLPRPVAASVHCPGSVHLLEILGDTLRFRQVELYPEVLQAVITALAQRCVLRVLYEKANGERAEVQLP
jgi:hypothetical protein